MFFLFLVLLFLFFMDLFVFVWGFLFVRFFLCFLIVSV